MPEPTPTGQLHTGQVGYVILGIKTTKAARVGDTLHLVKRPVEPLPGFRPAKSMVFAGEHLCAAALRGGLTLVGTARHRLCTAVQRLIGAILPLHNVSHHANASSDAAVWEVDAQ